MSDLPTNSYFPPPLNPGPNIADVKMSDIEKMAISLLDGERVAWETTVAFVTEKVAFNMKNLIRQFRKNWWGIFEEPIDPQTGRKKIWIPLTESVGETVVKNINLTSKDITFRAKTPKAVQLTALVRSIVRNFLDKMKFGEKLKEMEVILARDGTCVWKTIEKKDTNGKYRCEIRIVDLLNVYLDPTSPSIQEAYRFTERAFMYIDEIKGMKGWINTEGLTAAVSLPRNDGFFRNQGNTLGTVKGRDVWESFGKYPKYLMTGKKEDIEEMDLHIVGSGLESGSPRIHKIESYNGLKPYEEAWYAKVPGRWYGKGVTEKLMMLQLWINTIVNIRITRAIVQQLGLFTIRRGSGVTPAMLSRLPVNGGIVVNSQDDIKQLVMQEASEASYKDEDNVQTWAQKVTSAFESVTGEQLPSETSATATALQSHAATSQFVLIKENIGLFLQRWLENHALKTIFKNVTKGDLVCMALEDDELMAWDENIVNTQLHKSLNDYVSNGLIIDPQKVDMEKQRLMEKLQKVGDERFVSLDEVIDYIEYEVAIDITNESIDKGIIAQNLMQALTAAPEYRASILPQLFDMMGLTFQAPAQPQQPMQQNGQPAGQGAQATPQSPQTQNGVLALGRANTLATQGTAGG